MKSHQFVFKNHPTIFKEPPKEAPPSTISETYKNVIQNWLEYPHQVDIQSAQNFQQIIKKFAGTKVLLDRKVCDVILKMLKGPDFVRICKKQEQNQKNKRLYQITKCLLNLKYISRKMYDQIEKIRKDQISIQSTLTKILEQIKSKRLVASQTDELMQIWNQRFQFYNANFEKLWVQYIIPNLNILNKSFVKEIYQFYKIKIESSNSQKFKQLTKSKFQSSESLALGVLKKIVSQQLQKNIENSSQYKTELQILLKRITLAVREQFPQIQPKIQLFGSTVSGFVGGSSDIDITVFCRNNQRQIASHHILTAINNYFVDTGKPDVQNVNYIRGARVPVIKLKLNNKAIKEADIVLNNQYGVKNSKYLRKFSKNVSIKQFGVMIKMWAKMNNLIAPLEKFSSYSVILMVIFYLMKTQKLKFSKRSLQVKKQNGPQRIKQKTEADSTLLIPINLYQDFINFLKFYQDIFETKQFVCLLCKQSAKAKNCYMIHDRIKKYDFLINIHDPFDDTNPGKMTLRFQGLFSAAILRTLQRLQSKNADEISKIFKKHPELDANWYKNNLKQYTGPVILQNIIRLNDRFGNL